MAQALCWSYARQRKLHDARGRFVWLRVVLGSPLEGLRQPLAALRQQCSKRMWGSHKDELSYDIHQVMRDPPEELFADMSVDCLLPCILTIAFMVAKY